MYVLVNAFIFLYSLLFIWLLYKKDKKIMDLRIISIIFFVLIYALPSLIAEFRHDTYYFDYLSEVDTAYITSLLAAFLFFIVGLFAGGLNKRTHVKPMPQQVIFNKYTYLFIVFPLYIAGLYSIFDALHTAGGLTAVADGGSAAYLTARAGYNGIMKNFEFLLPFTTIVLIQCIVNSGLKKFSKFGLILFIFALPVAGYWLLTVRSNIVIILLLLVSMLVGKAKGISKWVIVFCLFAFITVAVSTLVEIRSNQDNAFVNSLYNFNVTTATIIDKVSNGRYLYGSHAADTIVFLIPRAIWPDKPVTSAINREFFPELARYKTEINAGLIAEGYTILGVAGVCILSLFNGYLIARLQKYIDSRHSNLMSYHLLFAIFLQYSIDSVRMGVFGKQHLDVVICLILYYGLYVLNQHSSRLVSKKMKSTQVSF